MRKWILLGLCGLLLAGGGAIAYTLAAYYYKWPTWDYSVPAAQREATEWERELPLAAHWNLGETPEGFTPDYQLRLLGAGHHLLPWLRLPNPEWRGDDADWTRYYQGALRRFAAERRAISLVSTQWESMLTNDEKYFNLPAAENPNVIGPDGRPRREVSPFGPVKWWREAGRRWTTSPLMKRIQEWYPDPPLVLFVSNNEHTRLPWVKAEEDRHFIEKFGRGRDDNFKRQAVGDGWIERYRALQEGMREGLSAPRWKEAARFIGYDAFGPPHFGRWPGWLEYSLYKPGRIDPNPLAWDGGSPSYYVFNWNESTDYTVFGPQVESMNWIFMLSEARRLNPNFWWEISTWDGHEPEQANDKRRTYAARGQQFTPARYGGMVQFGMWLLRPRTVREFRAYRDKATDMEPFFRQILEAVDRVHASPTLASFWRRGRLVPNRAHQHPYQTNIPPEYRAVDRWFLLDTSLDPPRPWQLRTEIPVFALALVQGAAPAREWLVYAHAPLGPRAGVTVEVPEFGPVRLDVAVGGSFYQIGEKDRQARSVR
jgi:hypothetical protein